MKKRLLLGILILSLTVISCPTEEDVEHLWLVGVVNSWSLKNPLAFSAQGNGVFVWQGYLPAGQLHFNGDASPSETGTWFGPGTNIEQVQNGSVVSMYRNSYNWDIATPGNYVIRADVSAMQVRFEYGAGGSDNSGSKGRYGNYYEIFVGSFCDSYGGNGVRVGNLRGLIQKLDYLNDGNPNSNTSLHIDGIWLMPINPSPSYHKYDVSNYKAIDSAYGSMQDFEDLIAACNTRGIRVIIDLVVNHTSTQHQWFRNAQSGNATYLAYYNISDTPRSNYSALHNLSNQPTGKYYESQFGYGMPDLNYDNPAVWNEMKSIVDFWLDKGVAGFRLDAVKHVYNTKTQNVNWLKTFVDYCRAKKSDVYIVAEVWDGASVVLDYYGSGIPSNFSFPFRDNISSYVNYTQGTSFAQFVVDWNSQIKAKTSAAIDAPFLTNHDMPRLASGDIGANNTRLKMAAAMLIFMPGNPFIYYGEELGMTGKNWDGGRDENVRGPMIWSRTSQAGQAKGPTGNNQPYWNASSVSEQLGDPNSILRFYIDALKIKNRYPQIHWGTPSVITTSAGSSVAAYRISAGGSEKDVAIVHNLSSGSAAVTINGAAAMGGTLNAAGASAAPLLTGASLTMPAYTTAVLEY